ncbi:lung seven transmembrane receptor-domain-containing protein [Lasiosphaeria miniovina]|uniref:Lung seven transmembrane receptor-domain-containing protein n=1 Tax=Lasiosphaeria miniovina TaxID=1954250 RepID=A0AA40AW56_9PEZI|nr:lung seven transmembrane receptor-domain-containing protein [Lasiosphaeria miniovina]KAK0723086.1 lung seven transmembrane receptor-domain-containing protein [Lasiosphaeria miniovina]
MLTTTAMQDETENNQQRCAGMYSRGSWGGPVEPFIEVLFPSELQTDQGEDPIVSLVIFEYKDQDYIGVSPPGAELRIGICEPKYVEAGYCNDTDIGEFILAENATQKSTNYIMTKAVHLKKAVPLKYEIKKTGYYCVFTKPYTAGQYRAAVTFRNAYGELPASQIPKLPFYGGVTILYAVVLVFWGFLYYQHRSDILAVQNYITAILIFLVVEMLMTWGFYDYLNIHGSDVGAKVLLIIVAILNAARNSFSFFLLLIVCMGYGVVKPTLGRTMVHVRWLAIVHFCFGIAYAVTSLLVTPDNAGPFVLLIVLPLAGTLTAFYVWTLNSLNFTLKDLKERKQHVKASMYKKLWWCILISILVIFAFFFFSSFQVASSRDPDFVPFHWKSRWFILDGWLNLVYFADVAWIAYVWRPTANNRRFAMSDEIAQEDDGTFEIANLDIGAPDDSDDDEEASVGVPKPQNGSSAPRSGDQQHYAPPSGAPPQRRPSPPRDSFDGETIFAVGEDGDKFSDDEGSGEEAGLVKGGRK